VKQHRILLIIPTFQEIENVKILLAAIRNSKLDYSVLFIDDSSPDGTGELIALASKEDSRIFLISRSGKLGVASAFILGFKFAVENVFDWAACMDADLSHRLVDFELAIASDLDKNVALYIGSRYVRNGKVEGVKYSRRALSILGNFVARIALQTNILDVTGGFRIYKVSALSNMDFSELSLGGYGFQLQILKNFLEKQMKVVEFPITFLARSYGFSKMKAQTIIEVLMITFRIGIELRVSRWFSK
jgi:glycosyltransferase involved in cell wall biosynthesis